MTCDKTYHLTDDGRAVDELDPDGRTLLMCRGGSIPDELAQRYGLAPASPAPAKAQKPARDKAERPRADKAANPPEAE